MHKLCVEGAMISPCVHVFPTAHAAATSAMYEQPSTVRRRVRVARVLPYALWLNASGRRSTSEDRTTAGRGLARSMCGATASCMPGATDAGRPCSSERIASRGNWRTAARSRMASTCCTPATTRPASTLHTSVREPAPRTLLIGLSATEAASHAARRTKTPSSPRGRCGRSSLSSSGFRGAVRRLSLRNSGSSSLRSAGSCGGRTGATYGMSEG